MLARGCPKYISRQHSARCTFKKPQSARLDLSISQCPFSLACAGRLPQPNNFSQDLQICRRVDLVITANLRGVHTPSVGRTQAPHVNDLLLWACVSSLMSSAETVLASIQRRSLQSACHSCESLSCIKRASWQGIVLFAVVKR